jgi:hypothetical protein
VTCGPTPLVACTTDDVVAGLAQISSQLHGLAGFVLIVSTLVVLLLTVSLVVAFGTHR